MAIEYTYIKKIISVKKFNEHITQSLVNLGVTYDKEICQIHIYFTSELSEGDKTTLDTSVESYADPVDYITYLHRYINTSVNIVEEEEWSMVCSWIEPGNELLSNIVSRCKLLPATPDDSSDPGFEYYIRVLDVTNNTVLGQTTMTNENYEQGVITISGFSNDESTLEFQAKKSTKGSRISVINVTCNYI